MKVYPSIPGVGSFPGEELLLHTFAKIDGSNLRAEWEKGKGWVRFGSRHKSLGVEHEVLGEGIQLFLDNLADDLAKIARGKWEGMVCFFELAGEHSFAGEHQAGETKAVTLFDVSVHRKGILGPSEFLQEFGGLKIPNYLGELVWDRSMIGQVQAGQLLGMSFEGVVGKRGTGHHLAMYKAKNRAWVEKVKAQYGMAKLIELEGPGIVAALEREL